MAVEPSEDGISDVGVLDGPAGSLERLLVPVGHPIRLAILRLEGIGRPEDRHLARPLPNEPRASIPDQEAVRLAVVRLHRGGDEAQEAAPFNYDVVQGICLRQVLGKTFLSV